MAIVIPKQHYVTIQYRKDSSTESGLLGFASPYTKDAAFEKRRRTQESWAYGGYETSFDIDSEDRILPNSNSKIDQFVLFASKCYPIITTNEPLEGFEVAKSVKRSGWNGSGNVVWRIADPRGFELEISSENFARVIDCATVENGKILGKCLWGRDGSKNILLPEASDVYQEAVKMTIKVNTKIALSDVQLGDTVELLGTLTGEEDDQVFRYLGKYCLLHADSVDRYYRSSYAAESDTIAFNKRLTNKYLVQSVKTGKYVAVNSLKVVNIINKVTTPLAKPDVAKEVTASLRLSNWIINEASVTIVSATKIDLDTVSIKLVPLAEKLPSGTWPSVSLYSSADTIVVKLNNQHWLAANKVVSQQPISSIEQLEIDFDSCKMHVIRELEPQPANSRGYGYYHTKSYRNVSVPVTDIASLEKYRIAVTAGDMTGYVYRLNHY